jgi:oligoendopeptidase F
MADQSVPSRSQIDPRFKWKLEDIYQNPADWEKDAGEVQSLLPQVDSYRGKLGSSASLLAEALEFRDRISRKIEKLFVYARMHRDEDNADTSAQARTDKAEGLITRVQSAFSFYTPEILTVGDAKLHQFLQAEPRLADYRLHIEEILEKRPHILSDVEERLIAELGEVLSATDTTFTMLNNADMEYAPVHNEKGEELELSKGLYSQYLESPDRQLRREAFTSLHQSYQKHINTLASTLSGSVKQDVTMARLRHYDSALQGSLDQDHVLVEVYESLIATVHEFLPVLHRYFALKQKALHLDELHIYDLYTPMIAEANVEIEYEDAKRIVCQGLTPLGEEYGSRLQAGLEGGWVDVYENKNKTSGAYAWGCYDSHPYVLLNYHPGLNSLLTLAHEMGHAMHSSYSNANQPYINAEYRIILAEVASTVNEVLVLEHLIATTDDAKTKSYLLNRLLEEFRTTVFRQTMFAEFEWEIHKLVENGEALTAETLSEIYEKLNRLYHGEKVIIDEGLKAEWARIPHFYTSFYVYKYSTGFSSAVALAQGIRHEGKPAVERYLQFLKSGNSDYPLHLLQNAGVDLTKPEPIRQALDLFQSTLEQLEKMLV